MTEFDDAVNEVLNIIRDLPKSSPKTMERLSCDKARECFEDIRDDIVEHVLDEMRRRRKHE